MRADVEATLDAVAARGRRIVLVHHDRRWTGVELVALVHRIARALGARGLGPGDLAVLLGGNQPEMPAARWAANLLGAGIAQPYAGLSDEQRGRIVDDVDAALVAVAPGRGDEAGAVLAHARPTPSVVLDDALLAGVDADPVPCRARPGDVQEIRHTGGTTGHPKGITYTFAHHLRIRELEARMPPPATAGGPPRRLVPTPLAHIAGTLSDSTLRSGGSLVLLDRFEPGEVLATIERERITDLFLLPPLIYRLLDHPDLDRADTSTLDTVVYGGTPAAPARMAEAVRRFGPVFVQVYAQTETGPISLLTKEEHTDPTVLGTAGHVLPFVEPTVCDDDGHRVGEGERGVLWVRTAMAMDGYWKQPELTGRTVTPDGWVNTGDVVRLDDRGYLHVVDRVGDVVVVVGGHVHTPEVESVLVEHPAVREAAVFGAPEADGSETVRAVVVTDAAVDPAELTDLVARRQGPMYAPAHVTVVDAMPLTDAGKVDKKALRAAVG